MLIPDSISNAGYFKNPSCMLTQAKLDEYVAIALAHAEGKGRAADISAYDGLILGDEIIDKELDYLPDNGYIKTEEFWNAYRYFMDLVE